MNSLFFVRCTQKVHKHRRSLAKNSNSVRKHAVSGVGAVNNTATENPENAVNTKGFFNDVYTKSTRGEKPQVVTHYTDF